MTNQILNLIFRILFILAILFYAVHRYIGDVSAAHTDLLFAILLAILAVDTKNA